MAFDALSLPTPLFEAEELAKTYRRDGKRFCALDRVTLRIDEGESVSIVGESGAGKSTLAKLLIAKTSPSGGFLRFKGRDITRLNGAGKRAFWKDVQMITQDPSVAFDPKKRVRHILAEPLKNYGIVAPSARSARMEELLDLTGLDASFLERLPCQMSGGEQQRLSLARALAVEPTCLILDEATSALDMTMQEQLVELLIELRRTKGLTYVFIHHDLGIAQRLSDRIVVMRDGGIVSELASSELSESENPYVNTLVSAIFGLNEKRGSVFARAE